MGWLTQIFWTFDIIMCGPPSSPSPASSPFHPWRRAGRPESVFGRRAATDPRVLPKGQGPEMSLSDCPMFRKEMHGKRAEAWGKKASMVVGEFWEV